MALTLTKNIREIVTQLPLWDIIRFYGGNIYGGVLRNIAEEKEPTMATTLTYLRSGDVDIAFATKFPNEIVGELFTRAQKLRGWIEYGGFGYDGGQSCSQLDNKPFDPFTDAKYGMYSVWLPIDKQIVRFDILIKKVVQYKCDFTVNSLIVNNKCELFCPKRIKLTTVMSHIDKRIVVPMYGEISLKQMWRAMNLQKRGYYIPEYVVGMMKNSTKKEYYYSDKRLPSRGFDPNVIHTSTHDYHELTLDTFAKM